MTPLQSAYQNRIDSIQQQLKDIQLAVTVHQSKFENDSSNWGYLGDISAIDIQLSTIKGFVNDNKQNNDTNI